MATHFGSRTFKADTAQQTRAVAITEVLDTEKSLSQEGVLATRRVWGSELRSKQGKRRNGHKEFPKSYSCKSRGPHYLTEAFQNKEAASASANRFMWCVEI